MATIREPTDAERKEWARILRPRPDGRLSSE